jgi:4-hydroxy-3-methylbut-2-enyl diphosphate reductase
VPTFHVGTPDGLVSPASIRHRDIASGSEATSRDWLPDGPVVVGLTSGASTPDNIVEQVIRRLDTFANS